MLLQMHCYDCDTDFIATEVPASADSPSYVEGTCPKCGEDIMEWDYDNVLGPEDIKLMQAQFMGDY